jgi:SSS family solute:Na+ symporter
MALSNIDIGIVIVYIIGIISLALWVSREKAGHQKDTSDYFLAGRSLPWWAVGASLIAANISAEQIIGMSGSAYAVGLAIATYEWTAAIALIVMAKYFLPIFLEKQIYTMPEFLEKRFDGRVRTVLALFWLAVYVFVNLTAVLWLGALAINSLTGFDLTYGLIALAAITLSYSIYGGLKAVAMTDIIQVVLLIIGGIAVTVISLNKISEGAGVITGFHMLWEQIPGHFNMILDKGHPSYKDLPGLSVLLGGLWISHFAYWGFNQYITQRALAAENLGEAQKGVMFAAYLKLVIPFIVVVPGIAAAIIFPTLNKPDEAYPAMMSLLPSGLLGLTFAALIAAIVSSLSSMSNSISTIFTMDVYKNFSKKEHSQQELVTIGRIASFVAMLVAVIAAKPLLGSLDEAFQYIQEFTGFFTPGILFIFLSALFWKRATAASALFAAITSLVLSIAFKTLMPDMPFIDRMGLVFVLSGLVAVAEVLISGNKIHPKAVDLQTINFKTSKAFNVNTLVIVLILIAFYTIWW